MADDKHGAGSPLVEPRLSPRNPTDTHQTAHGNIRGKANTLGDRASRQARAATVLISGLIALVAYILPVYLYRLHPVLYVYSTTEDYGIEAATAVAWLLGFVILAWTLIQRPNVRRPAFVAFTIGTMFMAGEEVSWGQRMVGIASPLFFKLHNTQGETNLHNLLRHFDYAILAAAVISCALVVPVLASVHDGLKRRLRHLGFPIVPAYLHPLFVVAAIYLLEYPLPVGDVSKASPFLNEWGEFYLALASLFLARDLRERASSDASASPARPLSMAASLTMVVALTYAGVGGGGWPGMLKYRYNYFAGTVYPRAGLLTQAVTLCSHMESHPDLLEEGDNPWLGTSTRVSHAELLLRMGRHVEMREVLERELVAQTERATARPNDGGPERIRAVVLGMLDRREESLQAFAAAENRDLARAQNASDVDAEAWARWSLAKTYLAANKHHLSKKEAQTAKDIALDGNLRHGIVNWMNESLP